MMSQASQILEDLTTRLNWKASGPTVVRSLSSVSPLKELVLAPSLLLLDELTTGIPVILEGPECHST